jgi:hypothetical protein
MGHPIGDSDKQDNWQTAETKKELVAARQSSKGKLEIQVTNREQNIGSRYIGNLAAWTPKIVVRLDRSNRFLDHRRSTLFPCLGGVNERDHRLDVFWWQLMLVDVVVLLEGVLVACILGSNVVLLPQDKLNSMLQLWLLTKRWIEFLRAGLFSPRGFQFKRLISIKTEEHSSHGAANRRFRQAR